MALRRVLGKAYAGFQHPVAVAGLVALLAAAATGMQLPSPQPSTNQAPVFGEGASATRSLVENAGAGHDILPPVHASDGDGQPLTYRLAGADAELFALHPGNGQLRTREGVAYDRAVGDHYAVTIHADDGYGGRGMIEVAVEVTASEDLSLWADAGWDLTVAAGGTAWLDGTGSRTSQGVLTYSWSLRLWPGDNPPSLHDPTGPTPSFIASAEGTYIARLTVGNGVERAADEVRVTVRPATDAAVLVSADLLVDTNRDGQVDLTDEPGEDTWGAASGAVIGGNLDDDDEDGDRDGWDDEVNVDADLQDMALAVARQIPGLHRNHTVVVEMAFASTSVNPRLFYRRADGAIELLVGGGDVQAELPLDQLVAGDLQLYIDSPLGRYIGFNGHLALTLKVQQGGVTTSQDSVALRGGPILFAHHLQSAERVFVMEIPEDQSDYANTALLDALDAYLPTSTEVYRIDHAKYNKDRWIQDFMQTGGVQRPGVNGAETARTHTRLHRDRDLAPFLPDEYLSPEVGYVSPGGDRVSSLNSGGNVEVIPPHTHDGESWPYGRIVIGGRGNGHQAMVKRQIDFFNSQSVQGPPIVVDTSWLYIAHVDEIFSVLPNRNAESGERLWVIAIGSPALAVELLEEAADEGFGEAPVFEGREGDETTVQDILDDSYLMFLNDDAQARIDTARDRLIADVGLTDADFREVPALFEGDYWSGMVALVPSVQNLLVANDVLLVPDPEGPDVDGTDIWQQATLDALDGLGLETHFVDVYYSYHVLLGAIHCGINVERAEWTEPWWLHVETEDSE